MIAKYEKRTFSGSEKVWVGKYISLRNISHWHREIELIACAQGFADVTVDDEQYHIRQGECVLCGSGHVHHTNSGDGCLLYVCIFDEELTRGITDTFSLESPSFQDNCGIIPSLIKIRDEIRNAEPFYAQRSNSLIIDLIISIYRSEKLTPFETKPDPVLTRYKELLSFLDKSFDTVTFKDAAEFMHFSPAYFSKYFKRQSGNTFSQYMNIVRVEKAVEMIKNGNRSSSELMIRCGFGTIRSFNRSFKEITGYTPSSLPPSFTLNIRTAPSAQDTFDPTLSPSVLVTR